MTHRVLVVEDDRDIASLVQLHLRDLDPGAAHLLPLEAPEKVAALMRREGSPGRFG